MKSSVRRWLRVVLAVPVLALAMSLVAPTPIGAASASPRPVVAGFSTPHGDGYWLVYANGSVTANGAARRYGDASRLALRAPIVGGAATPSGKGYWLVGADGGVFTFGDAHFFGSMSGTRLVGPVFSIVPTGTGHGYWLFARDGGVFTFGDARFFGSESGQTSDPTVGVVTTPGDKGYELLTQGGEHFDFGKVLVRWPQRGYDHGVTIESVAPAPFHEGFWAAENGAVYSIGIAPRLAAPAFRGGVKYIFSNPIHYGYVLITNSGSLIRAGQAPGV